MLLLIEGFEGFGTVTGTGNDVTSLVKQKYPLFTGTIALFLQPGRLGGYSLQNSNAAYLPVGVNTSDTTLTIGFGLAMPNTSGNALVRPMNAGQGPYLDYSSPELRIRGSAGVTLGTTSGANINTDGKWHYVEVKFVFGASGSAEVRVDGVTRLSLSGVNTAFSTGTYPTYVNFGVNGLWWDDIYMCDSTGTANNTFLGPQVVVGVLPTSDTATEQWTPSGGTTHFSLVGEAVCDGDTSYVTASAAGSRDLYNYGQLSGITGVTAIQINTICRQLDNTLSAMEAVVQSGPTVDVCTAKAINSATYVVSTQILETDPNTGQPWTPTAFNAAQFGIQIG